MKLSFVYEIIPEQKLVHEVIKGEVTIPDLIVFNQNKLKDPRYNPEYNILSDIREAVFIDILANANLFNNFLQNITANFKQNVKCAIIADSPAQTAFSELIKSHPVNAITKVRFEIFSTEKGAADWLGIEI
jgi:hypothetical protein